MTYNHVKLISGQRYRVMKPFTDFDGQLHPIGETWVFLGTNFLPYDDGLTLHVHQDDRDITYRLRWIAEDQGEIIDNLAKSYVEPVKDSAD